MSEADAYCLLNSQRAARGERQFDGISEWRDAGSPQPDNPRYHGISLMLDLPRNASFDKAFEAMKRLDLQLVTASFARAGVSPEASRSLSLEQNRTAWVVTISAGKPE